jgi:carboxyl-terminal processing protease
MPLASAGERRDKGRPAVSSGLAAAMLTFTMGVAACAAVSGSPQAPKASTGDTVADSAARVARVYAAVEANYLAPLDPDHVILDGAIRRALATLDPFSAFFDRDQFRMLGEQARGQALGFGSILYVEPGKVLVLSTAQGSPSWRAGLGPGDEIVELNGTRVAGLDFDSLVQLLQKARSGPVRLGVIHPGKVVPQDFKLNPAEVAMPTVDKVFCLESGIGYLHLTGFESKTPEEVAQAIERLESGSGIETDARNGPGAAAASASAAKAKPARKQLPGLILDLRDNHGGLVEAAVGVVSLFLPPGISVLTIEGGLQEPKTYRTADLGGTYDGPLVVLVNGETASAAEVVAAALEDHDRAVMAGEPTYGKGVVESVMPLSDGMGLALISAQYLTPSGRSIQRPLAGTALAALANQADPPGGFRTDNGRPLASGGGVTPDVAIPARSLDPWLTFLDQRGGFTDFASDYLSTHERVPRSFQPDDQMLSAFGDFLRRGGIRTPDEYWNADRDYLKLRLRTELMNLVYGLEAGDQVATEGDPQVQGAARLFGRIDALLKPAETARK